MLAAILFTIGLFLAVYAIYKWMSKNYDYFEKRNIKYIKPFPFLGIAGPMFIKKQSLHEICDEIYNAYPNEKIVGTFFFRDPFYFITDPDIIKQMAIKDFDHFPDHRAFLTDKQDRMFGNSLVMLRGQKWRDMRATLSPAFTGNKMRQMFEILIESANDMTEYFKKQAAEGHEIMMDMKDLFSKCSNDMIASTAFGVKVNSFENSENDFYKTSKRLMNLTNIWAIGRLILLQLFPSVAQRFGVELFEQETSNFFKSMVLEMMEIREKKNIFRPDMINIMIEVRKNGSVQHQSDEKEIDGFATVQESDVGKSIVKRQWSDDELVAQCFIFFLGGFDSISSMLSFTSYELALEPEVQQKLYLEIAEVNRSLNGHKLTYGELQKMKYMDMVVSEALRKWPVLVITDRQCAKDYVYDDGETKIRMEKGDIFSIPIYSFHSDEKFFPNPKRFDPERFSDENKGNIMPGSYLPFGIGPRSCIGSRFALMEMKAVLYHLLLHFKFQTTVKTQIPLKVEASSAGIITAKGIHLQLKAR